LGKRNFGIVYPENGEVRPALKQATKVYRGKIRRMMGRCYTGYDKGAIMQPPETK